MRYSVRRRTGTIPNATATRLPGLFDSRRGGRRHIGAGSAMQPAAQADQHADGEETLLQPIRQPSPAAQRLGIAELADRPVHRSPQSSLDAWNTRCASLSRSLERRLSTAQAGACLA